MDKKTVLDLMFGEARQSMAEFKKILLKLFNNLAVRKHWRIMGVFEHGEGNELLHFHGFFYIPNGQEVSA